MSWHLPHRLTPMHHAVSIALLYSISSVALPAVAQAATIGKTVITSAQHEPLAATITVTDIDATDFSAALANASVYQQMGLTPTDSMSVRFVPTSETSGQVVISTTKPISKPFADVVLALEDKGKRNVVPKTLLMPLNNSAPIKPSNQITASQKPDLPVVSAPESTPLVVKREAPPALGSSKVTKDAISAAASNSNPKINAANTGASKPASASTNKSTDISAKAPSTSTTDKQLDILSVEVTRKIKAHNEKVDEVQNQPSLLAKENPADTQAAEPLTAESSKDKDSTKPADEVTLDSESKDSEPKPDLQAADTTEQPIAKPPKAEPAKPQPTASETAASSYTVQSNDNLWIISQHIAKKNNLDIQTVMSEIQEQNPDAFVNQDPSQLKANAQLSLPNYQVVPSQKNIQTAIMAQRQQLEKPATEKTKTAAPKEEKAKAAQTPPKKTTQTLPQGRFSVVAPGTDGTADGTQNKAATATGTRLNNDIFNTLKASRQRNATQAKRLNATNSALSDYTQKLQLQNQKLADLEARLKKLRNQ